MRKKRNQIKHKQFKINSLSKQTPTRKFCKKVRKNTILHMPARSPLTTIITHYHKHSHPYLLYFPYFCNPINKRHILYPHFNF
jgi:hypothetical protein